MHTLECEPTQTLLSQEVSKHASEGILSHPGALLYPDLPLSFSGSSFTDFCAFGSSVGMAAAGECPGQTLLS